MNFRYQDRAPTPPPTYSPVDPSPGQQGFSAAEPANRGRPAANWNAHSPSLLVIPPNTGLHNAAAHAPAYELAGSSPGPNSPNQLSPSRSVSRASSVSSNAGAAINLTSPYSPHRSFFVENSLEDLTPCYQLDRLDPGDFTIEANSLRSALKGFNTDESVLISILSRIDPFRMRALRGCYNVRYSRDLLEDIRKKTSGNFGQMLMSIVRTPLEEDVFAVNKAIEGLGTNEKALDDILLCRTNADLEAIKSAFQNKYNKSLAKEVREDLSGAVQYLYDQVLKAQRPLEADPVDPAVVQLDIAVLYRVIHLELFEADRMSDILANRNDKQLRAILEAWRAKYQVNLDMSILKWNKGHYGKALALLLQRAYNRPASDAVLLEESMAGLGTRDYLLLTRVVRIHWDEQYMQEVKRFYATIYRDKRTGEPGNLIKRVHGETSGDYRRLLLACLG